MGRALASEQAEQGDRGGGGADDHERGRGADVERDREHHGVVERVHPDARQQGAGEPEDQAQAEADQGQRGEELGRIDRDVRRAEQRAADDGGEPGTAPARQRREQIAAEGELLGDRGDDGERDGEEDDLAGARRLEALTRGSAVVPTSRLQRPSAAITPT